MITESSHFQYQIYFLGSLLKLYKSRPTIVYTVLLVPAYATERPSLISNVQNTPPSGSSVLERAKTPTAEPGSQGSTAIIVSYRPVYSVSESTLQALKLLQVSARVSRIWGLVTRSHIEDLGGGVVLL